MTPRYHQAAFFTSAQKCSQLPADVNIEVAFAGRSNAGKSSAINVLTNQKQLAKTSKTPGRTQLINFFYVDPRDESRFLVDLPGYGYAKVPEAVKKAWEKELAGYLETRESLRGLFLLMDIRHPLTVFDTQMLTWATQANISAHVLLTKADKLKRGPAKNTEQKVRSEIKKLGLNATVQLFSSLKRDGLEDAYAVLDSWFEFDLESKAP